jgi:hypothetical protein
VRGLLLPPNGPECLGCASGAEPLEREPQGRPAAEVRRLWAAGQWYGREKMSSYSFR